MVHGHEDFSFSADVKTLAADNLIIDMLRMGAYTARGVTLSSDNGVTTPTAPPGSTFFNYRGKLFPRGCRGFLVNLQIYCKRTGTGTITLSYAPQVGMGAMGSVVITPGSVWDWKSAMVRVPWGYDSLFIWVSAIDADVLYGTDTQGNYECFYSGDSGASWFNSAKDRYYMRAVIGGATVGDVPVSGTLNVVEIPSVSTYVESAQINLSSGVEKSMITIQGSGTVLEASLRFDETTPPSADVTYTLRLYADGALAYYFTNRIATQSMTAASGRCAHGAFWADLDTKLHCWAPVKFKRSLEITAFKTSGVTANAWAYLTVNKTA